MEKRLQTLRDKAKFYSWVALAGGVRTCVGIVVS